MLKHDVFCFFSTSAVAFSMRLFGIPGPPTGVATSMVVCASHYLILLVPVWYKATRNIPMGP